MKPLDLAYINFRPLLTARHGTIEATIRHGAGGACTAVIALTRQEAYLLDALHQAQAKVVERRALRSAMQSRGETYNLLSQVIRRLRRKLEDAGVAVDLVTIHGCGYQMGVRT